MRRVTLRSTKIRIKSLWPVKLILEIIKRGLLIFCWSCDEIPLKWEKKTFPSLQFMNRDRMRLLLTPLRNDRSMPLRPCVERINVNDEKTCWRVPLKERDSLPYHLFHIQELELEHLQQKIHWMCFALYSLFFNFISCKFIRQRQLRIISPEPLHIGLTIIIRSVK